MKKKNDYKCQFANNYIHTLLIILNQIYMSITLNDLLTRLSKRSHLVFELIEIVPISTSETL